MNANADYTLTARQAAEAVREGRLSSEELVRGCLERIAALEDKVGAWAFLDPEQALSEARARDDHRRRGGTLGPLHGVPVAIKDNIDTEAYPTQYGSLLYAGRRSHEDAHAVAALRAAGAVILGKTVTTEFAVFHPGKTRNPLNLEHTPGGSSSGSAAAVAASMCPLAVGTQTNGSVVRPASFCGIVGYKPSFGWVSRRGVLKGSLAFDTVGVFARTLEDVALAGESMMVFDPQEPSTRPRAVPPLLATALEDPPVPPRLAFVKTSQWDKADPAVHEGFAELVAHLGAHVEEIELPGIFDNVHGWHKAMMGADLALNFAKEYAHNADQLSPILRGMIEDGQEVSAVAYNFAYAKRDVLSAVLDKIFEDYDAILTPAVVGEAPATLEQTGDPAFCTIWTFCGVPALSLPILQGETGLPIGVQLVGAKDDDARLLRTARWLMRAVGDDDRSGL